jgi:hypothetical protein
VEILVTDTLNPKYKPATRDSILSVVFLGNTARIIGWAFTDVDAGQMRAAAMELLRKADQAMNDMERKTAEAQLLHGVAVPPGSLLNPKGSLLNDGRG